MNKSESKYFNTALLMNQAFLEILVKKDFEYITVKEICEKAGVNRSTFYLHYETMDDLLKECLENANRKFNESFAMNENDFIARIKTAPLEKLMIINSAYLRPYLLYIKSNKLLYKATYRNRACLESDLRMEHMSEKVIRPILSRFGIFEDEQKFWIQFYITGIHAIIREWVMEDCKTSVEKMEKVIIQCIRPLQEENEEDL